LGVGDINLIAKIAPYGGFTGMVDAAQVIGGSSNRLPAATLPALSGDITMTEGTVNTTAYSGTVPLTKGGTGQITAQLSINALTNVSAATNEYVLTKDTTTGNAIFKVNSSITDHTGLSNLSWTSSGHTGTASNVAGFSGAGAASLFTTTGSGTVLALATSPVFVTPTLGAATYTTLYNTSMNTTNSHIRAGNFEIQGYSVGNGWLGDNVYFDGTDFRRRAAGYISMQYHAGNELQWRFGATSTAGSVVSNYGTVVFKANFDGTVALGGNINTTNGNYSGCGMSVTGSSITLNQAATYTTLSNTSVNTSGLHIRAYSFGIQSYSVNNGWIAENAYFDGAVFKRLYTGYTTFQYHYNDEIQWRFGNTASSGTTVTNYGTVVLKASYTNQTVALGGDISTTNDVYTGAIMIVDKDKILCNKYIVLTGNPPASSSATGTAGQIGWDQNYIYLWVANNYVKRAVLEDFPNTGLTDAALTEDGFNILLETGDKLLLNP
jgi:hypothetical protein